MKLYGIDTIEFGINIDNYDEIFNNFLVELSKLKQEAQISHTEKIINLGAINFVVMPKGQGFYSYKLQCEDFHICFMSRKVKNNSPIYIRLISRFLWQYNYQKALELFNKWFEYTFNIPISTTKISRLDICCDIDEFSFKPKDSNKFITRAKKKEIINVDSENYEGKIFSGFTIAKGSPLMCRIYNKTLEIKKSNKVWFKDIWEQFNWSGKDVWRIEFQARREILKEFNIEDIKDIDNKIEGLWSYYTCNWLTMRISKKDQNASRWDIDNKWLKIQSINNNQNIKPLSRETIISGNIDTLINLWYRYNDIFICVERIS